MLGSGRDTGRRVAATPATPAAPNAGQEVLRFLDEQGLRPTPENYDFAWQAKVEGHRPVPHPRGAHLVGAGLEEAAPLAADSNWSKQVGAIAVGDRIPLGRSVNDVEIDGMQADVDFKERHCARFDAVVATAWNRTHSA